MKSLSLLLLFTILSSTMGGKERSQACTPTDGYACCFAPGEVGLLSPKFFFSICIFFQGHIFFLPRLAWTTATATRGSFASSTAPTTWDIQTHNMMEQLRPVAALIRLSRNTSYMYIYMYQLYIWYIYNMTNNPPISILPVHLWRQILETHLCSIGRPTLSTGVGVFVCY